MSWIPGMQAEQIIVDTPYPLWLKLIAGLVLMFKIMIILVMFSCIANLIKKEINTNRRIK